MTASAALVLALHVAASEVAALEPNPSVPDAGALSAVCPPSQTVDVDLAAWKMAVEAAKDVDGLRSVLKQLEPVAGTGANLLADLDARETLTGRAKVDDFSVRLTLATEPEHVLQARFDTEGGGDTVGTSVRWIQVLRSIGPGRWSALGTQLSTAHSRHQSESCTLNPGASFAFVNLVSPLFKSIQTRTNTGNCQGNARGETKLTAFWGATSTSVVRLTEDIVLDANWYLSADSEQQGQQKAKVALRGAFPKQIVYAKTTVDTKCDGDASDDPSRKRKCRRTRASTKEIMMLEGEKYRHLPANGVEGSPKQ